MVSVKSLTLNDMKRHKSLTSKGASEGICAL